MRGQPEGYQPFDLSEWSVTAVSSLAGGIAVPLGRRSLRGLPFEIGDARTRSVCMVQVGGPALTIPLGVAARWVIFAHRQTASRILEGDEAGTAVATYELSGAGRVLSLPLRERFEIGVVPPPLLSFAPFLALPDRQDTLPPRYEGRWEESGFRQTEVWPASPDAFYLWAWRNPFPEMALERLRIVPGCSGLVLGGLTISTLEEDPFTREGALPVRVEIQGDVAAPVELRVDRGVATYPYRLSRRSLDAFIADPQRGWGEPQEPSWSSSWAHVAANPSATLMLSSGEEDLGSVSWGTLREHGSIRTPRLRIEVAEPGRNWVRVKVVDHEGSRVPCRVHFRSPAGIPYQPHGHPANVNSGLYTWHTDVGGDVRLGGVTYAYIDGTCEGWLPRGDVVVDVARGYEYEPVREMLRIAPGQQELTIELRRWIDMNRLGWFSGDSHVHFLSTQGAHAEARGEDLDVVNLLASQWGSLFTSTEEVTGRASISRDGESIVYASQENRQHVLGHLILWGLRDPVMPWCSGGPDEAELGGTLEATLSEWADRCHEQGGTVVIPHFPYPNGEPATLIATGRADGIEMTEHHPHYHHEYYRYLNCGYRLPLVGGTDKMSAEVAVGQCRTYARVEEGLDYDAWRKAVVAGRTFVTGGPMIALKVEGAEIGDTLTLPGPGSVSVEAWAEGIFPVHTLQIVRNGEVVASADDTRGARRLELAESIEVDGDSWIAARCGGPDYSAHPHHHIYQQGIFAHTSPVYVACGGEWSMFDESALRHMLALVEGGFTYIRERAPLWPDGVVSHHHGNDDHRAWLERPFREARAAIRARLGGE